MDTLNKIASLRAAINAIQQQLLPLDSQFYAIANHAKDEEKHEFSVQHTLMVVTANKMQAQVTEMERREIAEVM
jgi:hypothetical protein